MVVVLLKNDLFSSLVIKVAVAIKVGSLLVGDSDVGESLGFVVGTSLLGSFVVGDVVGVDEGFLDVGLEVGD